MYRWTDANGDIWEVRESGLFFVHPISVNNPLRHQHKSDPATAELLRLAGEVERYREALRKMAHVAEYSAEELRRYQHLIPVKNNLQRQAKTAREALGGNGA